MRKKLSLNDLKVTGFVTLNSGKTQQMVGASTNRNCPTVYCGSGAQYCSYDDFTCGGPGC